ncbi:MAG: SDR family oxidoreductase [Myxococcales bacterium]|nr:SDR family oxidoreductase [Myxococcales bacterium]
MKVLYIGGTGEISFACVQQSLALGHEVTVLNRSKTQENLPPEVRCIHGELGTESPYQNLGSESFDTVCQFLAFDETQIETDLRTFEGRTKQYVFISSASAYAKPIDKFTVISERTPLVNPFWEYSQIKARMEAKLFSWHQQARLPVTVVRPSHTYRRNFPSFLDHGDWLAERMLAGLPVPVMGDGTSLWTLTHAEDFARPFVRLIGHPEALGEAYHITGEGVHSWAEITVEMARSLGAEPELVYFTSEEFVRCDPRLRGPLLGDKAPSTLFNNQKIASLVGELATKISIEEGFKRVAESFHGRRTQQGPAIAPELDKLVDTLLKKKSQHTSL